MFSLLAQNTDGSWKFLTTATTGEMAAYLGKLWSLNMGQTIIGVENHGDGTTSECCRFESGEMVGGEDGRCRPNADKAADKKDCC